MTGVDSNPPPDLSAVGSLLQEHAARLEPMDLERVRDRAVGRRATPTRVLAHPRAAIGGLVAAGLLMTSGGAALGVSGLSTTSNAGVAQYGVPTIIKPSQGSGGIKPGSKQRLGVLGANISGRNPANSGAGTKGATNGATNGSTGVSPALVQPSRQLASTGNELPFTGYLAIPVMLIGLVCLGSGLALRRKTRRSEPLG
jgi:hypothetical protein